MTTQIEDSELNTELQELYLKAKQWISDLEFLHTETDFIKVVLLKSADNSIMLTQAENIHTIQVKLQQSILEFMHQLELLITEEVLVLDMSLIETYTQLLYRYEDLLQTFDSLKGKVFELNKRGDNQAIPL